MMIIELMGGLGNQLQQYALYRKYLKLGTKVKLDLCWFDESVQKDMKAKRNIEIDRFSGVKYEVCTKEERDSLLGKNDLITKIRKKIRPSLNRVYDESVICDPALLGFKDRYLRGYFACEYYYADILDELRDELILPEKKELEGIVSDIREAESRSCSVHLRRGDYLEEENMKIFGNICTDEYYGSAIDTAIKKGAGKFYIFSEDRDHALGFADMIRNKYGKEALYVDENRGDDSCYDI
ncbi:MAG: alpha-1,2-fucosyltransferase, partial [Lachnospiraceae bacterium]|nr:alpha-1,2-fucosyltransferase [Lachnospiraceae bacterium]